MISCNTTSMTQYHSHNDCIKYKLSFAACTIVTKYKTAMQKQHWKHNPATHPPDRDLKSGIQDWLWTLDERHSPSRPQETAETSKHKQTYKLLSFRPATQLKTICPNKTVITAVSILYSVSQTRSSLLVSEMRCYLTIMWQTFSLHLNGRIEEVIQIRLHILHEQLCH